jgi:hypothetical protein
MPWLSAVEARSIRLALKKTEAWIARAEGKNPGREQRNKTLPFQSMKIPGAGVFGLRQIQIPPTCQKYLNVLCRGTEVSDRTKEVLDVRTERINLPVGQRSIELAVDWQIRTLIRILCRQRFV